MSSQFFDYFNGLILRNRTAVPITFFSHKLFVYQSAQNNASLVFWYMLLDESGAVKGTGKGEQGTVNA